MAGHEDKGGIRPEDIGEGLDLSAATEESSKPADRTSTPTSDKLGSVAPPMAANLTPGQRLRVADIHNRTLENRKRHQPEAEWMEGGVLTPNHLIEQRDIHEYKSQRFGADNFRRYPSIPRKHWKAFAGSPAYHEAEKRREFAEIAASVDLSDAVPNSRGYMEETPYPGWGKETDEEKARREALAYTGILQRANVILPRQMLGLHFDDTQNRLVVAEELSAAQPEMVEGLNHIEFIELVEAINESEMFIPRLEEQLDLYAKADEELKKAGDSHSSRDVDGAIWTALNSSLGPNYSAQKHAYLTFLEREFKNNWQATDEELDERWLSLNGGYGHYAMPKGVLESPDGRLGDLDTTRAIYRVIELDPDSSPKQKLHTIKTIVDEAKGKIRAKLEKDREMTALLEPQEVA